MNAQEARKRAGIRSAWENYFETNRILVAIEREARDGRFALYLDYIISTYTLEKLESLGYEVEMGHSFSTSPHPPPQTRIRW